MLPVLFSPLQGYTEYMYRRIHHDVVGGVDAYYAPFVRWEKGTLRNKDRRDVMRENNQSLPLVPQVIAGNVDELACLCDILQNEGYEEINLNMGCPAPMQMKRHRGSALLTDADGLAALAKEMERRPDVKFSVKMRLGVDSAEDWRIILPILNAMTLTRVIMHPRTASQQYGGDVDMNMFGSFCDQCVHPVVYNGDIMSPADIASLEKRFPQLQGVMVGRGLLARPSMGAEYKSGEAWPEAARLDVFRRLHEQMLAFNRNKFPNDSQLLVQMHVFWEYQKANLAKKQYKKVMKSGSLRNYLSAVDDIFSV